MNDQQQVVVAIICVSLLIILGNSSSFTANRKTHHNPWLLVEPSINDNFVPSFLRASRPRANKNTYNNDRLTKSSKEEEEGDYRRKLSSAVENLFQLSQGDSTVATTIMDMEDSSNAQQHPLSHNEDPNTAITDLTGTIAEEDIFDYSSFPFEIAPELDPETYSSLTGTDVSPPSYYYSNEDEARNNEGSAMSTQIDEDPNNYSYQSNMDPEELHRLIMKQELGYETQSSEFKEALLFSQLQNRTIYSEKAAQVRHAATSELNSRQQRAIEELERQMEGFENIIVESQRRRLEQQQRSHSFRIKKNDNNNDTDIAASRSNNASQQSTFLQDRQKQQTQFYRQEMNRYKTKYETAEKEIRRLHSVVQNLEQALNSALTSPHSDGGEKEDNDVVSLPWVTLKDPESDEIFYMNEETREVSFEFPTTPL